MVFYLTLFVSRSLFQHCLRIFLLVRAHVGAVMDIAVNRIG